MVAVLAWLARAIEVAVVLEARVVGFAVARVASATKLIHAWRGPAIVAEILGVVHSGHHPIALGPADRSRHWCQWCLSRAPTTPTTDQMKRNKNTTSDETGKLGTHFADVGNFNRNK